MTFFMDKIWFHSNMSWLWNHELQWFLARRPKVPAEHVWPLCLCRGCAGNLEYTVGWTAKSGSPQCHISTQLKDVSVSTMPGALSALEALCDYALYTLHYIYITLYYISSLHLTVNLCHEIHQIQLQFRFQGSFSSSAESIYRRLTACFTVAFL